MSPGLSIYLNGLRAAAALVVLFIHATGHLSLFGTQIASIGLHHDAVIVFFALSGFVIAYAAVEKDRSAADFTINRLARIYSVVLPAIILTIAMDFYARRTYPPGAVEFVELGNIPKYAAICASMSGFVWDAYIPCFSNGPYWSLAYEVWYYAAFGIAIFAPTMALKVIGTVLILALMGPKMIVLMPCWLIGVFVFWLYRKRALAPIGVSWFLMIAPLGIYVALKQYDLNLLLYVAIAAPIEAWTGIRLWASGGFAFDFIVAVLVAVSIYGACRALDGWKPNRQGFTSTAIAYFAGISFSLYLFHSPLFYLFGVSLPDSFGGWPRAAVLIVGTILSCAALAPFTEYQKDNLRSAIARLANKGLPWLGLPRL